MSAPDAERLARSMLALLGHDDDGHPADDRQAQGSWSKAPDFASDPRRAAAVREASARDRERYLSAGLTPVDCRFCHVTVAVKKLGAGHTAVQWNSRAMQGCATFAEVRSAGGDSSRCRSCPKLGDSIRHAIAEGCLEEESSAPSPGDG
ncbi:hypothetical protein [Mycolicibacterium sp. 050158]|jgi:hypothetical protein|uniref:hypothetical protein n=1 Tax=Mycolicibacterium sp. 050158 TaxID=3090602 RepID=UPI00299CF698|nr:hypothetical protein [Mycolicibacterium sp. 050158]MDX1889981.1 hypothetical protein [Mycolicibacterium sp. 050158]